MAIYWKLPYTVNAVLKTCVEDDFKLDSYLITYSKHDAYIEREGIITIVILAQLCL